MDEKKIKFYLAAIEKAIQLIKIELGETATTIVEPAQPIVATPVTPDTISPSSRYHEIKSLLDNPQWPETVPQFQMREPTNEDQRKRAKAVMDMVLTKNLNGLDFLDFGCGEGWLAEEALRRGASRADGYDVEDSPKWDILKSKHPALIFTSAFHDIDAMYDVIMLYDVLDHAHDPLDVISKVKSLLKPNGVVYVRCHPWTSKHATHVFKQGINKAYIHLFATWEEIREQLGGINPTFTRIETDPVTAYRYWFQQFKVMKENVITEPVNEFFLTPNMKKLIQVSQKLSGRDAANFLKRMEIQFVDYRLET